MNNIKFRFFLILGFPSFLISCANTRSVVLFNELTQSSIASRIEDIEPVIQKNDLLSISVTSLNPEASVIFNTPNINTQATSVTTNTNYVTGYLVNQDGYIQFPVLGNIKASGLSKKQLRDNISKGLIEGKLLLDPIVNIRYLNYKVTVLGEVARPSVLPIPNEKITLLEAIGLAGDLTVYGRRDNILIIRETEGAKVFQRLNLNTNEIFTSPYYYLKSNDIVYVEPNKKKLASVSNASKWVPVFLSGLSAVIVIVDRLVQK